MSQQEDAGQEGTGDLDAPRFPWLVLPTYQEVENIADIVRQAHRALVSCGLPSFRILVVDDGSPDGTAARVRELAAELPDVELMERSVREGLGRAYVAGFTHAIAQGADALVQMDADLSHDPADIPRLVEALRSGADVVIGSRYVPGGGVTQWGLVRRLLSRGGSVYGRLVLGVPVRDLTGGFKGLRAGLVEGLDLTSLEAHGYGFQIETTYRAIRRGARVVEIPIVFRDRQRGKSKMTAAIAVEALLLVPSLRLKGRR